MHPFTFTLKNIFLLFYFRTREGADGPPKSECVSERKIHSIYTLYPDQFFQ